MSSSPSLSRRLAAFITALLAVVVLIVAALAYRQVEAALVRAAGSSLRDGTIEIAEILHETTIGVRRESAFAAADRRVAAALAMAASSEPAGQQGRPSPRAIAAIRDTALLVLSQAGRRVPQISAAILTDRHGVPLLWHGAHWKPGEVARAVRGRGVTPAVRSDSGVEYYLAAPVVRGTRDTLGFVVLQRRFQRGPTERLTAVIGPTATLQLGDSSWTTWHQLAGTSAPPPAPRDSLPSIYQSSDGQVIGTVVPVASTPWLVAATIPRDLAIADAGSLLRRFAWLATIALLVGGIGAWLLSRHVTAPLAELTQAARDLARGDYGRRVVLRRPDEFGSLAASFNSMAEQVESATDRLGQHARELENAMGDLRRSEEKYRRLVDAAHEGICTTGPTGDITYANRRMAEMLGCEEDDLAGRSLFDFMTPKEAFDARSRFARRMRGIAETQELSLLRRDGATIWVNKSASSLFDASGEFTGALYMFTDVTERRAAQERVRSSERYFRAVIEHASDMICIIGADGRFTYASPAQERYIGFAPADLVGRDALEFIHPEDVALASAALARAHANPGSPVQARFRHRHKEGGWRDLAAVATNLLHDPDVQGIVVNSHDYTEQQALQRQLLQSQKMEAVGLLAGGVAHDFNNLLTVVTTHGELLLADMPPGAEAREDARAIIDAGSRAAALTRQLLAFSRRQVMQPRVIDLNAAATDVQRILRRVLREDITLEVALAATDARVFADPTQIEQVLINLAVNARDAMPDGGNLTIETFDVEIRADTRAFDAPLAPGAYIMLAVRDTGVGMDAETKARAFEPFFTTKEAGHGTGLGLATVYGIVRQSGGQILVESEPGVGTTFRIYLPRTDARPARHERTEHDRGLHPGTGTILLVEDEIGVRSAARRILERAGYCVIEAASGPEGLALAQASTRTIDVLLTDMVMPGMNGRELATRLRALRPSIRTAFMSGYTEDAVLRRGTFAEGEVFIQKPFTPRVLTEKIHEALRGSAA